MDLLPNLPLILCFLQVSVSVQGLNPTIDAPVAKVTVLEGETAILQCSVNNLGDYKVSWFDQTLAEITFSDRRVTDDTHFNVENSTTGAWDLHIKNVTSKDKGNYLCSVNTDPVTSKAVNLEVLVPAKIRNELSSGDTVLKEEETLVLVCNVTGFPRPFVTWYKLVNGKKERLPSSGEVLIISNVSRDSGGTYECIAYNGAYASKRISVSIKLRAPSPTIDTSVANFTFFEGETAILLCSVENLGEYKVAWLDEYSDLITINDDRMIDDARFSVEHPASEAWNLHIENVTFMDQGQYSCRVNSRPVTKKNVHLDVIVPPKIRVELSSEDTVIKEGETLILVCNVTGVPKPVVTWYKLLAGNKKELNGSGEVLLIPNVSKKYGGTYECTAFNGASASKNISVSIEFSPKVSTLSKWIGQYKGKETSLDCNIIANPAPEVVWLKGDIDVTTLDREKYKVTTFVWFDRRQETISIKHLNKMFIQVELYENTIYSLKIRDIQKDDFGEYTCYARNKIGRNMESITLYDFSIHVTSTKSQITTTRFQLVTLFETTNFSSSLTFKENTSHDTTNEELIAESSGSVNTGQTSLLTALNHALLIITLYRIVE